MKTTLLILSIILSILSGYAQDSLRIFNSKGQSVSVEDIVLASKDKQFIFFGEIHDNPEAHALELVLLDKLYELHQYNLLLGMEMFEVDVQPIIDEYFSGFITQRSFENESRVWGNYEDYQPIVEYAKKEKIPLIATNIPRRYANSVYHMGVEILDSLPVHSKTYLPPLPMQIDTTTNSYAELKEMTNGHNGDNMVYSQSLKDATMAHVILNHTKNADTFFYHINGAYHTKNREGIIAFMKQISPDKILTITTVPASSIEKENPAYDSADFTLIVSDD